MTESGVRCPHCGGKTCVTKTMRNDKSVLRYRKCLDCGVTIPTREEPVYPEHAQNNG